MPERLPTEVVRRLLDAARLTDRDAEALAATYAALERGLAAFPFAELHEVEPPLRSLPPE